MAPVSTSRGVGAEEEEEGYCRITKEEYEEFQILKRDREKAKAQTPPCRPCPRPRSRSRPRPCCPCVAGAATDNGEEDRKLEAKLEAMLDAKLDAVIRRAILKAAAAAASASATASETDQEEKTPPPPTPPSQTTPSPDPCLAPVPEEEGRMQRWKRQGVDVDGEGRVTNDDWELFYARLKALADHAYHSTVHLEWSRQDPLAFAGIQRQLKAEFGNHAPWRQSWLAKKAADILRNHRHRLKAAVKRDPTTCPKKCSPTTYAYLKALVEEEDGSSGTRKRKQIASQSMVSSRISSSRVTHRFGQGGLEVYQNRFERAYSRRPSKVELDYTAKHGHQLMCQHFGIPFHDLSKRSRHNNTHKSKQSLSIPACPLTANDKEEKVQLGGELVSQRPSHLLLACSASLLSRNGDGDCGSNDGGEGK